GSIASASLTTESAAGHRLWSGTELHLPTMVDEAINGAPVSLISSADSHELDSSALSQGTFTLPSLNSLAGKQSKHDDKVLCSGASSVQGTALTTTVCANAVSTNLPYSIDRFRKNSAGGHRSLLKIDCTIDLDDEWIC